MKTSGSRSKDRTLRQTLGGQSIHVLLASILSASFAWGAEVPKISFSEIWRRAQIHSPQLQAIKSEAEASKISESRLGRHWLPRVYVDARAYSTDEPAGAFVSVLNQSQITGADFSPDALNHPERQTVRRVAVGLDLPLYEGGSKSAVAKSARAQSRAKHLEYKGVRLSEYVLLARSYAELLSLNSERRQLAAAQTQINQILKTYELGSKSNPVGYSGLLGLKNLSNRIEGLLVQNHLKQVVLRQQIRASVGELPENWVEEDRELKAFVDTALFLPEETLRSQPALTVRAVQEQARATENLKSLERSRSLPRVGLFAENAAFSGERGSTNSTTAGVYLRWDLFSGTQHGATREAELKSHAARSQARSMELQVAAQNKSAQESVNGISENLKLLEESSRLLEEQTRIAQKLFRNGAIHVLQLVEVLARRLDLLSDQSEAEQNLIQARAALLMSSAQEEVPDAN